MPTYDRICQNVACKEVKLDCLERIADVDQDIKCPKCGTEMKRGFTQRANAVVGDDIPGGYIVRHGICEEDGTPRKYYTKSEMRREAARRGLSNHVEHKPDSRSSDKSKHTSRWV